jgi:hypothetical protein
LSPVFGPVRYLTALRPGGVLSGVHPDSSGTRSVQRGTGNGGILHTVRAHATLGQQQPQHTSNRSLSRRRLRRDLPCRETYPCR